MIEVGKKYSISIDNESSVAEALLRTDEEICASRLLGEVVYIHSFGFLFKLEKYPKFATLNITWDILKWIFFNEDGL